MKTKLFAVISIVCSIATTTFAQQNAELKGETVYVTTEGPVELKFPADIFQARLVDPTAPYKIVSVGHSVQISAKTETNKPAIALVDEGKRTHSLILTYKKNLPIEKIEVAFFNYPTVKDLQQRVKLLEDQKAKAAAVRQPSAEPDKETPIVRTVSNTSDDSKGSYYALIEDGDKALKNNQYTEAQEKYQAVLRIQPDNDYAKKRLSDVNIKMAEKERLEKQMLADKVNELKSAANKAFYGKQYDQAVEGYNKVLALQPSDIYSKSQITVIEKLKADNEAKIKLEKEKQTKQELDTKIEGLRAVASKAFNEKRYDDAIKGYSQILDLNQSDNLAKSKIDAIQKIKEQDVLKSKQENENKNREETFKTMVANADKAFQNKDYEVAKAGYQAAKDLKPTDGGIDKKIKSAEDKLAEKENEEVYKNAIAAGDEAKKAQDFEKAKAEYSKAAKLFKDRNYPQDQINEINKSINESAAKLNTEKEKQKAEAEASRVYNTAIEKADKELQAKDLVNAKLSYAAAQKVKPEEAYPKDKLAEISALLENLEKEKKAKAENELLAAEINKKYAASMAKGKTAFDKKDYDVAKVEFAHAAELKPAEAEPKSRLDLIDKKLSGVDVDSKYDTAIARGNVALADKDYALALERYKQAQKIKPLETLALNQVKYVQELMKQEAAQQVEQQRHAEARVQEEIRRKRFDEGMTAYAQYETAAQIADYEGQLLNLKRFLNLIPDVSELNTYQFNAGAKIDFAKKKIQSIRDYLTRIKGASYQLEPVPYLDQDIEKKYENFNFTAPPEDQKYTATDSTNYNDNIKFSKEILLEKPRVIVADSAENINVSLQGIRFAGNKTFYKILVHNSDANEFLTGTMQLNAVKKDGSVVKSFPAYISSFPIVLPGKEFSIVYVTQNLELKDNDKLSFTINDRLKKKKIEFTVPGSVYNQEKKAK